MKMRNAGTAINLLDLATGLRDAEAGQWGFYISCS
jgi:hypothetical protein